MKARIIIPLLAVFILSGFTSRVNGQVYIRDTVPDSLLVLDTANYSKHSPHKATIYALVLPGLGQAYNKKYWKIPIVYLGFGALIYNISTNNKEVKLFTQAYRANVRGDTILEGNPYFERYPRPEDLLRGRDFYTRRVELSVIFTAVWYLLTVVDATVDAHFYDYDVSEDLTLHLEPVIIRDPFSPYGTGGLKLCMNF